MSLKSTSIARFAAQLDDDYKSDDDVQFLKRIAGWRCDADRTVLAYLLLSELRAIRTALESKRERRPGEARR